MNNATMLFMKILFGISVLNIKIVSRFRYFRALTFVVSLIQHPTV